MGVAAVRAMMPRPIRPAEKENTMGKNLILYFSRRGENFVNGSIQKLEKGNTEICAEYVQKAVGGDLFEVRRQTPYGESYAQCVAEARQEFLEKDRPALAEALADLSGYDTIFVLGPCWCGTYPMPVFSQLEKLDFHGKKVVPLMTHEGSGMANSERDLRDACQGAVFGTGLAVRGMNAANSEEVIAAWARENASEAK